MIKQLIKCLNENTEVSSWLINEVTKETNEQFYVIHKLETTRAVKTIEYEVTVYHEFEDENNKYLGSSSFIISHKLKKSDIEAKINDAVYAASFIKNKKYDIVKNAVKKSFKEKNNEITGFDLLNKIASIFFEGSKDNIKFNSLELFYEVTTVHVVNSNGVDLKKTLNKTKVEAIPSYNGQEKVELYKMFEYHFVDFDKVANDVKEAIDDVTYRYEAKPIKGINKVDVILRNLDAGEFFRELISDYSYVGVYKGAANKKIGDSIQTNIKKDALTIGKKNYTKADAFDYDGVLVKPTNVIKDGIITSYFGNNQYANYLGIEPSGLMSVVTVNKGKTTINKMKTTPYLEIIALSGIQVDLYSGYIGGEVRLALYFDGKDIHPVSGFSFSGNIDKCLETITLSKETISTPHYEGPELVKLNDLEIL